MTVPWTEELYTKGEIMRYVIANEIHHMGQINIGGCCLRMIGSFLSYGGRLVRDQE